MCKKCKLGHLVVEFDINTTSIIWRPNLQPIQMAPPGQRWNYLQLQGIQILNTAILGAQVPGTKILWRSTIKSICWRQKSCLPKLMPICTSCLQITTVYSQGGSVINANNCWIFHHHHQCHRLHHHSSLLHSLLAGRDIYCCVNKQPLLFIIMSLIIESIYGIGRNHSPDRIGWPACKKLGSCQFCPLYDFLPPF